MGDKKEFSEKLSEFFAGKGFYIVLLLCAALIGTSIWLMASGSRAMKKAVSDEELNIAAASVNEANKSGSTAREERPVGGGVGASIPVMGPEENAEASGQAALTETPEPQEPRVETELNTPTVETQPDNSVPVAQEPANAGYFIWPVNGPVERGFSLETLSYDRTMSDWRLHAAVDIGAESGTKVLAVTDGRVSAVYVDEMLGTVVEVEHANGLVSVYANLQSAPAVSLGQSLRVGDVIGAVGDTALGEIGEVSHLHFAMRENGQAADPELWLPKR